MKFGTEDLEKILNKKDMKEIINKMCLCLEESILKVHFNKDKPEYNNIFITNLRDSFIHVFDGSKFIVASKNDIINQLYNKHLINIETVFNDNNIPLTEQKYNRFFELLNSLNDDTEIFIDGDDDNKKYTNRRKYKIKNIKQLIYNNSDPELLKQFLKNNLKEKVIEDSTEND